MDDAATTYTRKFDEVLDQEHQRIRAMRGETEQEKPGFVGLSISGGGIRSASFATGVLQGLVAGDLLRKVDYLSTVSGGGYIGSSLTWYLTKGMPDPSGPGNIPAGTTAADFPYGNGDIGCRAGARQPALNYLRDHGKYLTPDASLNLTSAISVVVRSTFTSLLAYLLLLCLAMALFHRVHLFQDCTFGNLPLQINLFWWAALALLLAMGFLAVGFSVMTVAPRLYPEVQYAGLNRAQRTGGYAIVAFFTLLVIGSLPYFYLLVSFLWAQAMAAGLMTVLGGIVSAWELSQKSSSKRLGTLRLIIGAALLIYGLLLAGFLLSALVTDWWMLLGLAVIAVLVACFVNINYVGIQRMYRDRLMETFMPSDKALRTGIWAQALAADKALLEDFCAASAPRPYHLINTNLILVDSKRPKFRGRAGDSFLLSPLYCGSDATGWRCTDGYMKGGWSLLGPRGMTLATAMATSGAAANPNTGVAGNGITRNQLISALMTLLNLRLGYWTVNPDRDSAGIFPPNFLMPGLRAGIFGRGLAENAKNIQLSDGGHFENLGLYELLRRRLRLIIVSDAGADPDYIFGDLANAVERARVDFGCEIIFRPAYPLAEVVPGSLIINDLEQLVPCAVRPFAVADIFYNNGCNVPPDLGLLLYLKSTLIEGLTEDICGYYTANPEFPNQPTADQFFDEAQFEAYRELGYQLCLDMIKTVRAKGWL